MAKDTKNKAVDLAKESHSSMMRRYKKVNWFEGSKIQGDWENAHNPNRKERAEYKKRKWQSAGEYKKMIDTAKGYD